MSHRKKGTVEAQPKIDIAELKGRLTPGAMGAFQWSWCGQEAGQVYFYVERDKLELIYEDKILEVAFDWTPCRYGGQRTWFLCPYCHRRVRVLYFLSGYFLCRHCGQLNYQSSQESKRNRLLLKGHRIRKRLGSEGVAWSDFPEKPWYMHGSTYERLAEKALAAEEEALALPTWGMSSMKYLL